ncbi:hypothetical protein MGWOODY_Clf2864 [hydrothermal vent metagenome]|uniref:Uncharacterized protein n=1 Tax=hydrothermal vent metagenome TaxID=652676 RepID=A0A160V9B0_9ZZZZ
MALGAVPDGDSAVRVPAGRGGVRFDVALMHCLGMKVPLNHYISLRKPLFWVTELKVEVASHVGRG